MIHKIFSPAKLNLGLWIVNKNAEGYHELQSLFWPIQFGDEVTLSRTSKTKISFKWDKKAPRKSRLPSQKKNTIFKTLEALEIRTPLDIQIKKSIPLGSGLGGSSSNAGSIAKWLQKENFLKNAPEKILKKIGADIPFFLHQKPAWVEGVGEKITPLSVSDSLKRRLHFLLIFPPKPLLTANVFAAYAKSSPTYSGINFFPKPSKIEEAAFYQFLKKARNDLEASAIQLYPLLEEILETLRMTQCLYAGMSGSGSTCFAVFDEKEALETASKVLTRFCRRTLCRQQKALSLKGEQHGNHGSKSFSGE